MCIQIVEIYNTCRCLYYYHAIDRCARYGRPGHGIERRTLLVGTVCYEHGREPFSAFSDLQRRYGHHSAGVPDTLSRSQKRVTIGTTTAALSDPVSVPERVQERDDKPDPSSYGGSDVQPPPPIAPGHRLDGFTEGHGGTLSFGDSVDSDSSSNDWDDNESVVSVASSVTTIDGDIVGALFYKLLNFGQLRFLWRQLIAQSRSWKRSQRAIERLLHRYSQDLNKLAENSVSSQSITDSELALRKRASKFIRRFRGNLAQRICEAHYHDIDAGESFSSPAEDTTTTGRAAVEKTDESDQSEDEDDESLFILETVEAFLFKTEPILYLEANLKALVKVRVPLTAPLVTRIWNDAQLRFENLVSYLLSPPPVHGSTRLRWTCVCGKALHDDFVELRPGALDELARLLQGYGRDPVLSNDNNKIDINQEMMEETLETEGSPNSPIPALIPSARDLYRAVRSAVNSCLGLFTAPPNILPHHGRNQTSEETNNTIGACVRTGLVAAGTHDFLLLCIPFMRVATKLYQPEICKINSDQDFFHLLRQYYQATRCQSPWKLLRKVNSIRFIQFEMYRSSLTDIRECPSVPPPEMTSPPGGEYAYEHHAESNTYTAGGSTLPPIGPNLLAHLFDHPSHADVLPVIWRRIPRKLKAELQACPMRGSTLGWGLHLAEGMDWFRVFVLGCAGSLVCLAVSVIWSAARGGDVQGGFTIGGFLLTFFFFCVGMVQMIVLDE